LSKAKPAAQFIKKGEREPLVDYLHQRLFNHIDDNRVANPDLHLFELRIQKGKIDPQRKKKVKKFHVLKCWMFSFKG
jgi:hypothetical protein